MVVSSTTSQITALGNSVTTVFQFPFIADSASDIQVSYTDASGNVTILSPSTYTLTINAAATGQLWGVGGSVLYPVSGSPIASGTFLTIQRILPYTQPITISNQGDFAPAVIEEMGDTLEMQIQQIAARTTQFRGIWKTGIVYYIGDIVQDGSNGNNTKNYYICQIANTSGTWTTDLAAGDWTVSVLATVPSNTGNLTLTGDVTATGAISSPIATTLATVNSNVGQFAAVTANGKGLITAATALTGDITSAGAATTLATVNTNVGTFGSSITIPVVTVNAKGLTTGVSTISFAGAGFNLIKTAQVSAAASAGFSSSYLTGYTNYLVLGSGLYTSSGVGSLNVTFNNINSGYYYGGVYSDSASNVSQGQHGANASSINMLFNNMATVTTAVSGFALNVMAPGASAFPSVGWVGMCIPSAAKINPENGAGMNTNTTGVTSITFTPSAGNITGTLSLYGYNS